MPACSSCRQPVKWYATERGSRMPVDPMPVDDGNIVLRGLATGNPDDRVVHVLRDGEQPFEGELRYRSHFASCPKSDLHRRRRRNAA